MDPFEVARDELGAKVEYLQVQVKKMATLVEVPAPESSSEFAALAQSFNKQVKAAERDNSLLKQTVDAVESNRGAFPGISDSELEDRKRFVHDTRALLGTMKGSVNKMQLGDSRLRGSDAVGGACGNFILREQRASSGGGGGGSGRASAPPMTSETIQSKISRQDEDLEELGMHIDRVGEQAHVISEELRDQGRMLVDLDEDLERAQEDMGFVMQGMSKLLKTKNRCHIWTVLLLSMILLILVACTIWT